MAENHTKHMITSSVKDGFNCFINRRNFILRKSNWFASIMKRVKHHHNHSRDLIGRRNSNENINIVIAITRQDDARFARL